MRISRPHICMTFAWHRRFNSLLREVRETFRYSAQVVLEKGREIVCPLSAGESFSRENAIFPWIE